MYKKILKEVLFGCAVYSAGLLVTVAAIAFVLFEGR